MDKIKQRFIKYVSFDTKSDEEQGEVRKPSTDGQLVLAKELKRELRN